jgi:transposase
MSTIRHLGNVINEIESAVTVKISLKDEYRMLLTTPGIGQILGLTIMLEVGDICRFKKAGNYSSYCRCVESKRLSNGKKKGANNKKNGNRYLAWAYVEAAYHAARSNPQAQRFFQRKMSKSNRTLATKALANKLTKATYYMMRDQVPFDLEKLFR